MCTDVLLNCFNKQKLSTALRGVHTELTEESTFVWSQREYKHLWKNKVIMNLYNQSNYVEITNYY